MFVCLVLVFLLCIGYFFSKKCVEFIKVYNKISCEIGSDVNFGSYGDVRVIALVGEEWGNGSGNGAVNGTAEGGKRTGRTRPPLSCGECRR